MALDMGVPAVIRWVHHMLRRYHMANFGEKKPEPPSKIRWDRENSIVYTVKFMRKTDQDVIDFLDGKNRRNTILEVVRYYMQNHPVW